MKLKCPLTTASLRDMIMNACMQGTLPSIVPNNKTRIYTQNCLVNTDAKRVSITETIISENTLNQGIHAWVNNRVPRDQISAHFRLLEPIVRKSLLTLYITVPLFTTCRLDCRKRQVVARVQ